MKTIDATAVSEIWFDSPVMQVDRRPRESPEDFGGDDSIGLHLKTKEAEYEGGWPAFGMFLGRVGREYVVGVKNRNHEGFQHGELFETVDEMKARWWLD